MLQLQSLTKLALSLMDGCNAACTHVCVTCMYECAGACILVMGLGHIEVVAAKQPLLNLQHAGVHLNCLIVPALSFPHISNVLSHACHIKAAFTEHFELDLQRLIVHLFCVIKLGLLLEDDANVTLKQDTHSQYQCCGSDSNEAQLR